MAPLTNAKFPLEILELIFVNLSPADLKSAVAVCRRWREAGESPQLWAWVAIRLDLYLVSKFIVSICIFSISFVFGYLDLCCHQGDHLKQNSNTKEVGVEATEQG